MGFEILAEKLIASTAVKALSTELRVVCDDSVANGEPLHLRAKPSDDTNGLMTYELLEEFIGFTSFSSNVAGAQRWGFHTWNKRKLQLGDSGKYLDIR